MAINRPKTQFIATKNKDGDAIVAEALDDVINQKAGTENKYKDGTVAQRGDVVCSDGGRYVVVNPMHGDGFMRLTTIENPTGFTRTAPIDTCLKYVPDVEEKQRAIEVLKKIER